MKIRTKLIVAFILIIFVPVVLLFVIIGLLSNYHLRSVQHDWQNSSIFSYSTIQVFNQATESIKEDVIYMAETDPDQFLDVEYIKKINTEYMYNFSHIAVEKEDELYYNGLEDYVSDKDVEKLFDGIKEMQDNSNNRSMVTMMNSNPCLVSGWDVDYSDGSRGRIILVSFMGTILPGIRVILTEIIIIIMLLMILIAFFMIAWIYKDILRRITVLKKAAKEIKNGNLDYELNTEGNDEIAMLCQDFEEMRLRLKNNAEQSVKAETESKELISNISHDLKTPITAIKGYVEGIMDGVASSPEKLDKYIRTIYVKANDMDKLIDELTIYSKIDTNRIPYNFSKINISDYFDDCINELGIELESKGIILNFSNFLEGDIIVIADSEQLKRVINNIVSNSVKYMDKSKGIINVRLKDVGDYVQIEIEDNGKGIAAKDIPYIFDRFYRTDSSRNSAQGGSGIGLAIVKKIIEDHGGNIWATSKEGVGTVMYIVIRKHQEVVYEQNFDN